VNLTLLDLFFFASSFKLSHVLCLFISFFLECHVFLNLCNLILVLLFFELFCQKGKGEFDEMIIKVTKRWYFLGLKIITFSNIILRNHLLDLRSSSNNLIWFTTLSTTECIVLVFMISQSYSKFLHVSILFFIIVIIDN